MHHLYKVILRVYFIEKGVYSCSNTIGEIQSKVYQTNERGNEECIECLRDHFLTGFP